MWYDSDATLSMEQVDNAGHVGNFSETIVYVERCSATSPEKTPGKDPWRGKSGKLKTVRKYRKEITCTKNENFITVVAVAYPMWK